MDMEAPFEKITGSGWRLGFNPLFKKEIGEWLEARRWLVQTVLWLVVLNGFLAMVLFVLPNIVTPEGGVPIENPVREGLIGFFGIGGLALSIGIIIVTQNEIIGEKQSGTAEWVLSKPVARSAFFLAKLLANAIGMFVIMIGLQSLIAYAQVTLMEPGAISPLDFLAGMGMLALQVFFYLSLTLMMGVVAENREMVLGVSLGTLLIGLVARNFVGKLTLLTPWLLSDLAGPVAFSEPLTPEMWLPIISTAVLSLVFIAVALWRFERHEF
jgi:ABC-2 type transport system permease protein